MKIAIVGGGISGLVAGYLLHEDHEITLFEAADYVGGHTNTVDVDLDGSTFAVDTGFIVFNDRTYPNFIELLGELRVESKPTQMTLSVSCERTGLEYRGADFNGLFAQRRNLLNPRFLRLLWDLLRFNKMGAEILSQLETAESEQTVEEFFQRNHFSQQFLDQYFMPMGAAIWSSSFDTFKKFPIRFIAEFYHNHGLLSVKNRPQWRVIKGGSRQYIEPLTRNWRDRICLNCRVEKVERIDNQVIVKTFKDDSKAFDHIIFACHSDQALKILADNATESEREILSAFRYQPNVATLHTQESILPKNKRSWACWNYFVPTQASESATVTYNMNMLQSLDASKVFCVTLNDQGRILPENVIKTFQYSHPTFGKNRKQMQNRHRELIGPNQTSFCGAYWGNGFHEDGVVSALAVVDTFKSTQPESVSP